MNHDLLSGNKIYFASDFHLGAPDYEQSLVREKKVVAWLDEIKKDAQEIFLVGDLFDFWFEYKNVVPKGFVRLLGKIAELTDSGIKVHVFTGNHDMWMFDYFTAVAGEAEPRRADAVARQLMLLRDGGMVSGYLGTPEEVADSLAAAFASVMATPSPA